MSALTSDVAVSVLLAVVVPFLVLAALAVLLFAVDGLFSGSVADELPEHELPAERPYGEELPRAA